MKACLLSCVAAILLIGCRERLPDVPIDVRIEEWYPLGHPIERFREMVPDRPLVVFFYCDWDLGAQMILNVLDQPQVYDLLTEYKVLPMLANYGDMDGLAMGELTLHGKEQMGEHCFLVVKQSGDRRWISSDGLHGNDFEVRLLEQLRAALE